MVYEGFLFRMILNNVRVNVFRFIIRFLTSVAVSLQYEKRYKNN